MAASEIWALAKKRAPCIQLRDVWFILGQFRERGLVECLTPKLLKGRLHYWTDSGCRIASLAFGIVFEPLPRKVEWEMQGWVMQGKVRRHVLLELARPWVAATGGTTASEIRRHLRDRHPTWLNSVVRVLKELEQFGLVNATQDSATVGRRNYTLDEHALWIIEHLR